MRREFSAKVKVAAFKRADGKCEDCGVKLATGAVEYDHDTPDQMGGEPTLENCRVRCKTCHRLKTSSRDIPMIARAKRVEAKHLGAKAPSRNPLPGGRNTPWKKKMDGSVVRRAQQDSR